MRNTTQAKDLNLNGLGIHPGRDWFAVLSGTAHLQLGERSIIVSTGEAAEFSTMTPHGIAAHDGPVEILMMLSSEGETSHVHQQKK